MSVIEAEPVQRTDRRRWPRAQVSLPVRLVDTEGTFGVTSGETVDISVGGVRALVDGPLPGGFETTLWLDLTDRALVCEALVAGGGVVADGWEYRLAFRNLGPEDVATLERLVASAL